MNWKCQNIVCKYVKEFLNNLWNRRADWYKVFKRCRVSIIIVRNCHIITVTTLRVFLANGIIPFSIKWMTLNIECIHYFIRYLLPFGIGIGV